MVIIVFKMDQKMIKNALKEARDAIKNKNHAIAMKLSKVREYIIIKNIR